MGRAVRIAAIVVRVIGAGDSDEEAGGGEDPGGGSLTSGSSTTPGVIGGDLTG